MQPSGERLDVAKVRARQHQRRHARFPSRRAGFSSRAFFHLLAGCQHHRRLVFVVALSRRRIVVARISMFRVITGAIKDSPPLLGSELRGQTGVVDVESHGFDVWHRSREDAHAEAVNHRADPANRARHHAPEQSGSLSCVLSCRSGTVPGVVRFGVLFGPLRSEALHDVRGRGARVGVRRRHHHLHERGHRVVAEALFDLRHRLDDRQRQVLALREPGGEAHPGLRVRGTLRDDIREILREIRRRRRGRTRRVRRDTPAAVLAAPLARSRRDEEPVAPGPAR